MREETGQQPNYGMVLEKRAKAMLTGVTEVESFDDGQVVLSTHGGRLVITGAGLHVSSLVLEEGKLSAGHARAILAVPSGELQKKLAQKVIAEELSVRQTEALTKRLAAEPREAAEPKSAAGPDLSIYLREAEKTLATRFGRKVHIINGRKKGKIELEYYNPEDLNTLLELLEQLPSAGKGGVSL